MSVYRFMWAGISLDILCVIFVFSSVRHSTYFYAFTCRSQVM